MHLHLVGLQLGSHHPISCHARKGSWKHKLLGRKREVSRPSCATMYDQELLSTSAQVQLSPPVGSAQGCLVKDRRSPFTQGSRDQHGGRCTSSWDTHMGSTVLPYLYATALHNFRHSKFQSQRKLVDFRATTQPFKQKRIFNSEL